VNDFSAKLDYVYRQQTTIISLSRDGNIARLVARTVHWGTGTVFYWLTCNVWFLVKINDQLAVMFVKLTVELFLIVNSRG